MVGSKTADLIIVNDGDLGYTKIGLDSRSLATVKRYIDKIEDQLARTLVLSATWEMCRDGELSAHDYVDIALRAVAVEDHPTVLRILLSNISTAVKTYSAPLTRKEFQFTVADRLFEIADHAKPGSDLQFQVAQSAIRMARSNAQLNRISQWLEGHELPEGFTLDTDGRWTVVQALAGAGRLEESQIDTELERDNTATGREAAWWARAAIPTMEAKKFAFNALVTEGSLPNMQQRSALYGFREGDPAVLAPFVPQYLDALSTVWTQQTYEMAQQLSTMMFPTSLIGRTELIDVEVLLDEWLENHPEAPSTLRRTIVEHLDNTRRALAAQAVDADR